MTKNNITESLKKLPKDYNKLYTLSYILNNILSVEQRKRAITELLQLLEINSTRTLRYYYAYEGKQGQKGRIPKKNLEQMAQYFDIEIELLYNPYFAPIKKKA